MPQARSRFVGYFPHAGHATLSVVPSTCKALFDFFAPCDLFRGQGVGLKRTLDQNIFSGRDHLRLSGGFYRMGY